tara:strand:+ start:5548 stop:5907 length:360 start_codon:yes stop_codon:yes gene_type:complete
MNSPIRINFHKKKAEIIILLSDYSENCIRSCFYWYVTKYEVNFQFNKTDCIVSLESGEEIDETNLSRKVKRDLNDFKLREIINNETKALQELIIAKAYANNEALLNDPDGSFPNLDPNV